MKLHLTTRMILFFVFLTAEVLAVVGWLSYRSGSENLKAAVISEMLTSTVEKEAALDAWIKERLDFIQQIASESYLVEGADKLIAAVPASAAADSARAGLRRSLEPHATGPGSAYTELFVMDPLTGRVLVSTHPREEGKLKAGHPYFDNGKTDLYVQAPYNSTEHNIPLMTAAVPLRASNGRVVGVLAARLDLDELSRIVRRRTGLRQTDDAFLVNAEQYPVTQPRFIDEPVVLLRKLDSEAVRRCAARDSGVMLVPDYRGVPSIVVCRWNAKRQLGLIVKIDQAEALAPVHAFGRSVMLISGFALLIAAGLAVLLARTITRPLRKLHARIMRFGEDSVYQPLPESAGDELGLLAREFNKMSARVAERNAALTKSNDALREKERILSESQRLGHVGSWFYDMTGPITWSDEVYRLYGVSPDTFTPSVESLLGLIHRDDRAAMQAWIIACAAGEMPGELEYRVNLPDGTIRYLSGRGEASYDAKYRLLHLAGTIQDISERKKGERELQLFRTLLDHSVDGIYVTDPTTGCFIDANERCCRDLGYTRAELLTLSVFDISVGFDRQMLDATVTQLRKIQQFSFEAVARRKDGSSYPVEINASLVTLDREYSLAVARDITERKRVEQALQLSEQRHRLLFESSRDALMTLSPPAWQFTTANHAALLMLGASSLEQFTHLGPWDISAEYQPDGCRSSEKAQELIASAISEGALFFEWECKRLNGETFTGDVLLTRMQVGTEMFLQATLRDISARKKAEQELRLASEALANIAEGVLIADADSKIVFANKAFSETSGYALEEALGRTPAFLHSGRQNAAFYKAMWEQLLATGHWQGEVWDRHKNGSIYPILLSLSAMRNNDGSTHYVSVLHDISTSKRYEAELEQQAHHDALTQLPNRTLFRMRLELALAHARSNGTRLSLLFLDLDRFKIINDSLGHAVGDELLRNVSTRLERCVRDTDTVARFGGDEFAILLDRLDATGIVAKLAQKILDTLAEVFVINGNELFISASIGITMFPDDGADIQTLFKNADSAMYEAKAAGRNAYRFFASSEQGTHALEKLHLGNDLRHAIARHELHLEYQPRYDLKTGKIQGFEALTRWRHPVHGMISPSQFIPIAEQTGQIETIGVWVLREACRQLRAWRNAGLVPPRVAINLSGLQFARADLPSQIAAILKEYAIEPGLLELELTESVIMADAERSTQALAELNAMGFPIAIDDFGTGYSSLSYLKRFPVTYLKIDQSFVAGVCDNADDAAITRAIIALAKSLGLKLIAEGVETEGQRAFLEREACDEAQGFLFSHSLPAEQAAALCARVDQPGQRLLCESKKI